MYRIDAAIERKTRYGIGSLHQLELAINGHGLFVGIRALWQVVFMYVQTLHISEVRLIVIDLNGQYDAVAVAIKVSGNHFEIER